MKTKADGDETMSPPCLFGRVLKAAKETSTSEYVVSNRDGEPLSYTQFKRLWQYIVTRTVKERSYYRYEDGKRVSILSHLSWEKRPLITEKWFTAWTLR